MYQRPHEGTTWNYLASTPGTAELVVDTGMIPHGDYEFAVTAVDALDRESGFHTSLDATANPAGGWYLHWGPPI